ncbi:hypothetical protein SteCoe_26616 [Stentor coeruleus]|uniref:Uncharacterized protein n=1 Tax=Stentor coeruleus TaxID=5963 RepID=A0A1R2BCG3_9CILI|nr:hypothetical protein SteCoe_26616 [Stentor coeruleus]
MENSELRNYLQKSRQERRHLVTLAEEIIKPSYTPQTLESPTKFHSEFPSFNPKRLMKFKEQINQNLQQIFRPQSIRDKHGSMYKSLSKENSVFRIYIGSKKKKDQRLRKSGANSIDYRRKAMIPLLKKSRFNDLLLQPLFRKSKIDF